MVAHQFSWENIPPYIRNLLQPRFGSSVLDSSLLPSTDPDAIQNEQPRAEPSNPARENARMDHVDGLRLIAVTGVLLFHFGLPVPGGFLGVDVFFVISGFLMSRAMLNGAQDTASYSIRRFIRTRIFRLCPALFTVIFPSLVAGLFILPENLINRFLKSASSACFFFSNMIFMSEGGYHAVASTSKPLLHTWSLAVEGQFYLLWSLLPLLKSRVLVSITIAAITILSFSFTSLLLQSHPTMCFFAIFTRLYEFGIGLIAVYAYDMIHGYTAHICNIVSCCIIFHNFIVFTSTTPTLGVNTMPLLAACVALISTPQGVVNNYVLSSPLFRYLGKLSYSAYLVHWPAIVLCRFALGVSRQLDAALYALLITIVGTPILFYMVEERYRLHKLKEHAHRSGRFTASALVLILCLIFVRFSYGFQQSPMNLADLKDGEDGHDHYNELVKTFQEYEVENRAIWRKLDESEKIMTSNSSIKEYDMIIGDSYAVYIAGLFSKVRQSPLSRPLAVFAELGCYPTNSTTELYGHLGPDGYAKSPCAKLRNDSWSLLLHKPPRILFLAAMWTWDWYKDQGFGRLEIDLPFLKRHASRVILLGVFPLPSYDPSLCLLTRGRLNISNALNISAYGRHLEACPPRQGVKPEFVANVARLSGIAAREGVDVFDPVDTLCSEANSNVSSTSSLVSLFPSPSAFLATAPPRNGSYEYDKLSCKIWDAQGGLLYADGGSHLTRYGASLLAPQFLKLLESV